MKIRLPEKVNKIIEILLAHGYEAYAVGGCVRDSLLSRAAEDWDITTSAGPMEVKALFRRTVDTGIQHGTVTVMLDKEGFEVTTYRIDGEYEDGRHPKEVQFTKNLAEDLRRRDFTINAMAYNEQSGIVDIFGGVDDLKTGLIRCVGNAGERFDEDALRILRAFRFSAQLDFVIEEGTRRAAAERAGNLNKISAERIRTELNKLFLSNHPDRLLLAQESGITSVVLPEFDCMLATPQHNSGHQYNVGEHALHTMEFIGNKDRQETFIRQLLPDFPVKAVVSDKEWSKKELQFLRWAALLHDVGKPETHVVNAQGEDHFPNHAAAGAKKSREVLRRLKFDNETTDYVTRLAAVHDYYQYEKSETGMRETIYKVGADLPELLWELQLADVLAQHPATIERKLQELARIKELHRIVTERGDCVSLKQLAVTGRDLIEAGMQPGPHLGEVLAELLAIVLKEPEKNTKEQLISLLKQE